MKLLRFNESNQVDNIKDYFIDFIDDDFNFSIKKSYSDKPGFTYKDYPFNGCEYIIHTINLDLSKSSEYKNYADEFINAINRCCQSEGFEIKNYSTEHHFYNTHRYIFKCELKEPFEEEVDSNDQFMNDFMNQLKQSLYRKTYNSSFSSTDIKIEKSGDNVLVKSTGGINTSSKFKTLSNWVKSGMDSYSSRYTFDVNVQIPRFENGNMVRPGILTLSNIKSRARR